MPVYTVNVWATVHFELEVEAESADAAKEVALSRDLSPHEVEHCDVDVDVDVDCDVDVDVEECAS